MPTETTTGRYEMLWDCPGCETPGLLGLTHRHCPNCGAPQDPTRRYFPNDDQKVTVEDHPFQGEDVACPACDTPNAAKATFCVGCGSPLDGAKAVGTRETQTAAEGFDADSSRSAAKEAEEKRQAARREQADQHAANSGAPPSGPTKVARAGIGLAGMAVAGLLVLAVLVCGTFLFWKKDAALVVNGHTWERTIAVETYSATKGADWKDQLPTKAYDVSCAREQRDTKKVRDGETCVNKRQDKGDGSYETKKECSPKYTEEPVYDDKCRYTVDAWVVSKTEKAAGSGLEPGWPTVKLTRPGSCLGCQREGARKDTYTLQLFDETAKEARTCEQPEARWRSMADGSRWKGSVGVLSGSVDCSTLQPR